MNDYYCNKCGGKLDQKGHPAGCKDCNSDYFTTYKKESDENEGN